MLDLDTVNALTLKNTSAKLIQNIRAQTADRFLFTLQNNFNLILNVNQIRN